MNANGSGLQGLLARLLVDERALQVFRQIPDSLVREYGLTVSQADALKGLDATGLDFTARTVRTKREDRLGQRFPLTFSLLRAAGRLDEVIDSYALATLPIRRREESRLLTEAQRFVTFLDGMSQPDLPPYTPDLARYELLRLDLSVAAAPEPAQADRTQADDTPPADLDDERIGTAVPVLSQNVLIGSFTYDVVGLVEKLLAGPCVPDAHKAPTSLVLVEAAEESSFLVYRVPPAVLAILTRCDGSSTFREIASTRLDGASAGSILRGCLQRGIVRLRQGGNGSPGRPSIPRY